MRLGNIYAVAAAVVAVASTGSCETSSSPTNYDSSNGGSSSYPTSPSPSHPHRLPMPLCKGLRIQGATIAQLQDWMASGSLTSQDLVQCYLARIDQTNPYLNSISEINPDALSIAAASDSERSRASGGDLLLSPLHGIPFVVKDNIYTDDAHNTSEGGMVLLGGRYVREATIVTRMRAAGAVLLGHATMSEAADHRALSNFSDGYSSRGGQIRNPFNLTQATSGSSGGSAVAVASDQCAVALGTETHGSLLHPASHLGLYTIKSTPGLLSRHGIVTGSFYHDTPGALARSMADVATVMDALLIGGAADPYDNLTWNAIGNYPPTTLVKGKQEGGFAAQLAHKHGKRNTLKGMKFGVPWNPYWSTNPAVNSPSQRVKYEEFLRQLKAAGAHVYNISYIPGIQSIANPYGFGQPADTPSEHNQLDVYSSLLNIGYGEWLQNWTFPSSDPRSGGSGEGKEEKRMSTLAQMAAWNNQHNATTGALGGGYWWYNTETGQDWYMSAKNYTMDDAFWVNFSWGRRTARAAMDGGHVVVVDSQRSGQEDEDDKRQRVEIMDALLVPNDDTGGGSQACGSIPSYAGYPVAAVPLGQSGYSVPYGICLWGREYGEAKLVHAASAIEESLLKGRNSMGVKEPKFYNMDKPEARWEAAWPGYTCSEESLDRYACETSE